MGVHQQKLQKEKFELHFSSKLANSSTLIFQHTQSVCKKVAKNMLENHILNTTCYKQ